MKRLLLLLFLPMSVLGQNTIGFPEVLNYSRQEYLGGLQNWDIRQDKNGLIYVANNEGLLSFDGKYWNLYPLPNKTIVRSVEIGADQKIYVGGQDELGYFAPGKNGHLEYHSLKDLLPKQDRSFGDVWDIVILNKDIYFRTAFKIFRYRGSVVQSYTAPSQWLFMGTCNGILYAQDFRSGLLKFDNNIWRQAINTGSIPDNDPITAIMPSSNGSSLVATLKNGLYKLQNGEIRAINSPNNRIFSNERIYAATPIDSNWMALATNSNGIYIVDHAGNIIQQFSKKEQLQNNNVLSIFLDNQRNLWLGLDNGIDFIAYNSAIKHITPMLADGSGYTSIIFGNRLYAGTSTGLYSVELQNVKDLSFSKGDFNTVIRGQIWSLAEINNKLLLGQHEGAFMVEGNSVRQISSQQGFWNFVPLSNIFPAPKVVAGNYTGIRFFDYGEGNFSPSVQLPGFDESSRFVAIDKSNQVWVSHPYHGIYRIRDYENFLGRQSSQIAGIRNSYIDTFTDKHGLPSLLNNHAYKIRDEVVIATEKGVYEFDEKTNRFIPSEFYKKILGDQSIRYLSEDKSGNIWFIHEKQLGVIDLSGSEPKLIHLPELTGKMLSGFEFLYAQDDRNIFLGGEKGFYHINYEKYKSTVPQLSVQVRKVHIRDSRDSILFGGYLNESNQQIPGITQKWKSIQFEFSSSLFGYQSNLEYSFRLRGFDDRWSEWSNRTDKEFTNLGMGKYTFEVKVRNNLGNESKVSSFSFEVLPRWYETVWARVLLLLTVLYALYLLYGWQKKKFIAQQKKFDEEQSKLKYIHELEKNKSRSELVALQNEKLEAEINFKNSEMASAAMHLVKKGELLTKIKGELTQMMKRLENEQAVSEVKKMIRSLNDDENLDKEWEGFSKHFDKVHSDFLVRVKEVHPNLTGNEMKLCTYLRMNLSTKEIAQLMNISVRGVEISRYRLRKKMGLSSEVNLFDYLINIK